MTNFAGEPIGAVLDHECPGCSTDQYPVDVYLADLYREYGRRVSAGEFEQLDWLATKYVLGLSPAELDAETDRVLGRQNG